MRRLHEVRVAAAACRGALRQAAEGPRDRGDRGGRGHGGRRPATSPRWPAWPNRAAERRKGIQMIGNKRLRVVGPSDDDYESAPLDGLAETERFVIAVKSSAYLQLWDQRRLSRISF